MGLVTLSELALRGQSTDCSQCEVPEVARCDKHGLFLPLTASCVSGGDETKRRYRASEAEEDHDARREGREPEVCVQTSE